VTTKREKVAIFRTKGGSSPVHLQRAAAKMIVPICAGTLNSIEHEGVGSCSTRAPA
jgi:hypothetical protein